MKIASQLTNYLNYFHKYKVNHLQSKDKSKSVSYNY
jgi:hypothetical protein